MTSDEHGWILSDERGMLDAASAAVPSLDWLTKVARSIASATEQIDAPAQDAYGTAIVILGAMGFRSSRSVALLLAAGYGSEAFAPCRRLTEIAERAESFKADPSRERARSWLNGRSKRPSSIMPRDAWDYLSPAAHADSSHLPYMSRLVEPRTREIYLNPCRDDRDELTTLYATLMALNLSRVLHDRAGLAFKIEYLADLIDERADEIGPSPSWEKRWRARSNPDQQAA